MTRRSTYEELDQRVKELEKEADKREEAEEELRKYQFMIESAHDAIFFKDLGSRYISANNKTLEVFGLSREDVIGKNDYELMPDQKEAKKNVHDDQIVFKSGKPTEVFKHMTGADGKEYWFQAIKVPQFDNDGKVIGLVGIARDITKQKSAEEALRKAHDKLEHRVEERTKELGTTLKTMRRKEKEIMQNKSSLEKINRQLMETNQALSVLARNIDKDKEILEKRIYNIISGKIKPIIKELQMDQYCKRREADLEVLAIYLDDLTPGITLHHDISTSLSEQEMRVAVMIKNGLISQKIANMLHISLHTVKTHRKNIRKKLNIQNSTVNLASYLKSKMVSDSM